MPQTTRAFRAAPWISVAAGIFAAAAGAYLLRRPRFGVITWGNVFGGSAIAMLYVLVAAAVAVLIGCAIFRQMRVVTKVLQRGLLYAVWMPPLVVLLRVDSAWVIIPACLLAVSASAMLRWFPARPIPVLISTLLQTGILCFVIDSIGFAAIALGLCAGLVAVMVRPLLRRRKGDAEGWMRVAFAVVTAFALMVTGFAPFVRGGGGGGAGGTAASGGEQAPAAQAKYETPSSGDGGPFLGGSHKGIILWPDEEKNIRLVPPLPAMGRGLSKMDRKDPLSIPFYGVYWLFREPYKKPPSDSYTLRGNPAVQTFRSADFVPLQMEAHQNFGVHINLTCCSQIQVAIVNADRYPGSVSVELLLMNTSLNAKPFVSLGKAEVTTTPSWRPGNPREPIPELLTFPVPATAPFEQFDEATVRFHMTRVRSHRSARIAIDRFVLVPRRGV